MTHRHQHPIAGKAPPTDIKQSAPTRRLPTYPASIGLCPFGTNPDIECRFINLIKNIFTTLSV